jgi:hypothetical protein
MKLEDFAKIYAKIDLASENNFVNFMKSISKLSNIERESLHGWDVNKNYATNCSYLWRTLSDEVKKMFINPNYQRFKK